MVTIPHRASTSLMADITDATESTWVPTITFDTPGDLSVAYSTQLGHYIKLGTNLVLVFFTIVTSTFTHTTAAGNLRINTLPFTARGSVGSSRGAMSVGGITKAGYGSFVCAPVGGATHMLIRASGTGVADDPVGALNMPTGGSVTLRGNTFYLV